MNTDTLAKLFWSKRLEHSFTCNDIAVYFALLDHCTALGGKNPFHFSAFELQVKVGMKTKDPLDTARNRLKQAGLIDYKNGQGRGNTTQYYLVTPDDDTPEKGEKKGQKNTPYIAPFSAPFSPPFSPVEKPTVRSSSLRSRETTTTTTGKTAAVAVGGGGEEWGSEVSPALVAEWQKSMGWMQAHAPRCLELNLKLLTPDKLGALCATYTLQHVQEAMRAIHGEASAAKYTCLATGLDKICRHRWPAQASGRAKPAPPASLYGPVNADVVAELEAKERQEAEERFRKSKSRPAAAAS